MNVKLPEQHKQEAPSVSWLVYVYTVYINKGKHIGNKPTKNLDFDEQEFWAQLQNLWAKPVWMTPRSAL